jgi:hypothetical protein
LSERFAIPRIHFATPVEERAALVEELKGMYRQWVGSGDKEP